jgi:arabinose-5-phosphate isomerase
MRPVQAMKREIAMAHAPIGAGSYAAADTSVTSATASALRTLDLEIEGLQALRRALGAELAEPFAAVVALIAGSSGRVIVSGMGKSGHIGQKIAATLASTGTPAFFVHPGEASHGDLGMITTDDVVVGLSWSGETAELANLVTYARRFSVPLVAITSRRDSTLARSAHHALILPSATEACPHGLAPTTSSAMQLAIGDALAIALLEGKGFSALDFKVFHPGGQLGAALRHVSEIMHVGDKLPLAAPQTPMADALVMMTEKSFGCLGVVDDAGQLVGILTDGDLRRSMRPDLLSITAGQIMTAQPRTIAPDELASTALHMLNTAKITALFVVDDGKPVGIVHIHDLLRLGVA